MLRSTVSTVKLLPRNAERPATFPQVDRIIAPTLSTIFGHCLTVFKLILLTARFVEGRR